MSREARERMRNLGAGVEQPEDWLAYARDLLFGPKPIERLELLRILLPLAILGFMSSRLIHADYWLTSLGFQVPNLGHDDYRQPLYIHPISIGAAWTVAVLTFVSGAMVSIGLFTRAATALFATLLTYLALADRLEAFTVSKISPFLIGALFLSRAGARYSIDAWRKRRRDGDDLPTHVAGGSILFFQAFLVVFYCGSGIAKMQGDWLTTNVLWTHVHDNYQTGASYFLVRHLPTWSWMVFQFVTLVFEAFAPLWFALGWLAWPWMRYGALVIGLGLHTMIGLMFGPVVWFALLMAILLACSFLPDRWLLVMRRIEALFQRRKASAS